MVCIIGESPDKGTSTRGLALNEDGFDDNNTGEV